MAVTLVQAVCVFTDAIADERANRKRRVSLNVQTGGKVKEGTLGTRGCYKGCGKRKHQIECIQCIGVKFGRRGARPRSHHTSNIAVPGVFNASQTSN